MRLPEQLPTGWACYLLLCSDGSYYCGITGDLRVRLTDHASGKGSTYTNKITSIALVWFEAHPSRNRAAARESEIKKWGRPKKRALANSYGVWVPLAPRLRGSG